MDEAQLIYERELPELGSVYRFVETEDYANDLLVGNIWITTLASCRRAEGNDRRDEEEGRLIHRINSMSSDDPRFHPAINQTGVLNVAAGVKGVRIIGGGGLIGDMNAYVLCTTERYAPQNMEGGFGRWCVEISNPFEFFKTITLRFLSMGSLRRSIFGRARYFGREVADYELAGCHPGLLKPTDGYTHQQEVRMLWEVSEKLYPIKPFSLECPEAARFCMLKSRGKSK